VTVTDLLDLDTADAENGPSSSIADSTGTSRAAMEVRGVTKSLLKSLENCTSSSPSPHVGHVCYF